MNKGRDAGQSIAEYAIVIAVALSALFSMQMYLQRSIQAGVKHAADQIGDQTNGIVYETGDYHLHPFAPGTVLGRESMTADDRSANVNSSASTTAAWSVQHNGVDRTDTTGQLPQEPGIRASNEQTVAELNAQP